jgi:hypothetical protein
MRVSECKGKGTVVVVTTFDLRPLASVIRHLPFEFRMP